MENLQFWTETAPKTILTSTAYPLLTAPAMGMYLGMSAEADTSVQDKLAYEFKQLVDAELDALEDLTVSGSSSATESTMDYIAPVAGQMYTAQYVPKHMMFNYAQSQKGT